MTANTKARSVVLILAATCLVVPSALAGGPRHYRRGGHAPAPASDAFRLGIGLYEPDANSDFWDATFFEFTGTASSFEDTSVGADFLLGRGQWGGVLFSLEHVDARADQGYREDPGIVHETKLQITPLTVGFLFFPAGRRATFAPYLGAGAGFYWWRYTEVGDFIDFAAPLEPIVFDAFESDGVTLGYYLIAGLDVPIRREWSLFVEGRWHEADDELDEQFEGLGTLDLSGREIRAGFAWRF
ncbi:MAG: outer membrane beta-barrel protein [Acidobacteriota bacterium]|nr:MAG: outer membrane beta-barrel protein [Acidobacteriota bacterium]